MTTTHSARVYAHAKRKKRTLKLLDQLSLVLIGEPVAGKCTLHFRKYDYGYSAYRVEKPCCFLNAFRVESRGNS